MEREEGTKDRTSEQRIERLERELRRTRRWLTALSAALLVGCVSALAAPGEKIVRANRFVLEDASGAERASLAMADDLGRGPEPMLSMRSADEQSTLELGLVAADAEGRTIGWLDVEAFHGEGEAVATLVVGGSEGRSAAFFGLHDRGQSALFGVVENRPQLVLARPNEDIDVVDEAGHVGFDRLAPSIRLQLDDGRAELRARDADGNAVPVR